MVNSHAVAGARPGLKRRCATIADANVSAVRSAAAWGSRARRAK
jgi:hypothetical protein